MSDDAARRGAPRERLRRGARGNDDQLAPRARSPDATPGSTLAPGKRTLVEAAPVPPLAPAVGRPGARTLTEALPALDVEPAGAFDAQLAVARTEITVLAEAITARDASQCCQTAARVRSALEASSYLLNLAEQRGDETVSARRAVLADVEALAAPVLGAAFRPSRAALDEACATRTFTQWDAEVRAWQGPRAPTAAEENAHASSTTDATNANDPRRVAARGVEGNGERLPFADRIQQSFGRHDVSRVRAHIGGAASRAARQLGARAFAFGDRIAFDGMPDLHTAAHEAAHHVQQRAGVALEGGIDHVGDEYELHADAVADAVVRGASAEPLLDRMAGRGASASPASPASPAVVQRKTGDASQNAQPPQPSAVPGETTRIYLQTHSNAVWDALRAHLQGTSWPAATAQFTWLDVPRFTTRVIAALHDQVMVGAQGGDINLAQLDALLYPTRIHVEIAPMLPIREHGDGGTMANQHWIPAVGLRIGQLVRVALVPSVTRMTQRYVDATNARAEQAKHELLELEAKDLIASSPLDRIVARGLVIPGVAEVVPNGAIKPTGRTALRPVRLTWQGAHDPKLWAWVRADLPDATVEEVAASLFGYARDARGDATSYYAYGIAAAAPLFGLPASWAIQFPEARAHAPKSLEHGALPDEQSDSIASRLAMLAATDDADAIALRQAAGTPVDKGDPAKVLAALDDSLIQLGALRSTLVPWDLANDLVPVIVQLAGKREQLRAASEKDVRAYAAVAFGQRERLVRIAGSVTAAIAAARDLSPSRGADNPVRPLLAMYARAAAIARLAETSEVLIASAQDQQRALVLKSLQANQLAAMQAMDEMRAGPAMQDPAYDGQNLRTSSKGARELSRPYDDVQRRARQLEDTLLQGGEVDRDELQRVQLQQQNVALHARINNLTAQLQIIDDEAYAAERGLAAKLASLGSSKFRSLRDASQAIRLELVRVRADLEVDKRNPTPRSGDADGLTPPALDVSALRDALVKAQARFTKLSDDRDLSKFLEGAYSIIKNQRLRTAIVNTVAMIGVSFAGSALAGLAVKTLGRGMLAAASTGQIAKLSLGARGGLFAARVATETLVQSTGQLALTGGDPWKVILENTLMNVGMAGTQGAVTKDLREAQMFKKALAEQVATLEGIEAAALKRSSRLGVVARAVGREALVISGETVMGMALGMLSSKVVDALDGEAQVTAGVSGTDAILQGASVAIGRLVHARIGERRAALADLAHHSPGAKALQAHAHQLEALAAKLMAHPEARRALDVLAHQERLLKEEIRVIDELLARTDHGGYDVSDLTRSKTELAAQLGNAGDAAMLGVKLHLSGLRELAPDTLWSGTPADIARGVAELQATRPDAQVERTGGITKVRVGDRVIEMHEVAEAVASTDHPTLAAKKNAAAPATPHESAERWSEHLRSQLDPEATKRYEQLARNKSALEMMDTFRGDFDVALSSLGTREPARSPDTADKFTVGPLPKSGAARWKYLEDPAHWTPERAALHERLIANAKAQAQKFAEQFVGKEPTLYAMRGNTAAGKTRAVSGNVAELAGPMQVTKDLPHRSVNPDNFKADLIKATPGATSSEVHSESSMLAARLERELLGMHTTDGKAASMLLDRRLLSASEVRNYAALAKATGRRFVLFDVDAPLEHSLAGVLERTPGGSDPLPPFEIVADGFDAVRKNRKAVIEFFSGANVGTYHLYGTLPNGERVEAAIVKAGKLEVANKELYEQATSRAERSLASTRISSKSLNDLTKNLPTDRRTKIRGLLEKYDGWTWKAALDAHSREKPK